MSVPVVKLSIGYCPESGEEQNITVNYVPLNERMGGQIKDTFSCTYLIENGCSLGENCPIYKADPEHIE